jgi:anti-anti-sigma factor
VEVVFTSDVESSGRLASSIALKGELDRYTTCILEEFLERLEADRIAAIVIDLREVTNVGSVGLRALLAARARAEAEGYQLLFVGARPHVRRAFELTGSESLLTDRDVVILPDA